ncbi:MAG: 16S rRNA (guanine(966)-N(2))-methyltransferase RsmD [Hyphomonadaceae bacterium]
MRVVGGNFRGRHIRAPEGRVTRPTSDRTREALFNILMHAEWAPAFEGLRVIDAFAGSGALGVEALSRGAAFCLFIEADSAARGCIRDNIEHFQLFGVTRIHRRSATDLGTRPASLGAPFDLVFMDPPYGYNLVPKATAQLESGGWLTPEAILIAETGSEEDTPDLPNWSVLDTRLYGAARITIYKRENGARE